MINEILILHHSHFDYGYTHPQPVLRELQVDHIENAIKLCDETVGWEPENRPSWTCEVTMPVMWSIDDLPPEKLERLSSYIAEGRIRLAAMSHNPAATLNLREGVEMLQPAGKLRRHFKVPLKSAILHDVNGISFAMADAMVDAGVDFLLMGINVHFGGYPFEKRPYVFDWLLPSGRTLRVFNAEHYGMFNYKLKSDTEDIEIMEQKLQDYFRELEEQDYPYDWAYLSATIRPHCDNTGPNPNLANVIRKWNKTGHLPIRYVNIDQLRERIHALPNIPVHAGDWSDFWSFGVGSNAHELRISRRGRTDVQAGELLAAANAGNDRRWDKVRNEAWHALSCYTEHTYGSNDSVLEPDGENARTQNIMKRHFAHTGRSQGGFAMERQLERLANNPIVSQGYQGILLVNPGPLPKTHWMDIGQFQSGNDQSLILSGEDSFDSGSKPHTLRFGKRNQERFEIPHNPAGLHSFTLPPYSWRFLSLEELTSKDEETNTPSISENSIESATHRLVFNPRNGALISLVDKRTDWEVIPEGHPSDFFSVVRETPVPKSDSTDPGRKGREELFAIDWELIHKGIALWQPEWKAARTGPGKLLKLQVLSQPAKATLLRRFELTGTEWVELCMTLSNDSPSIELTVQMQKTDIRTAESYTMSLPLNLPADWKGHYDTCGVVAELDAEQLPNTCREFLTVDRMATIHHGRRGVTLVCPDAPLVHLGGDGFGRQTRAIKRDAGPVLSGWLLNNYWDTNFPASQPGLLSFRYHLLTHAEPDFDELASTAIGLSTPVYEFDTCHLPEKREGRLLEISDSQVAAYVYPIEGSRKVMIILLSLSDRKDVLVKLPSRTVLSAHTVDPLGNCQHALSLRDGGITLSLRANTPSYVQLSCK